MHGTEVVQGFALSPQNQLNIRTAERYALKHALKVFVFSIVGTQEFTPCRHIEKQVTHFNSGTLWMGCGPWINALLPAITLYLPAVITSGGTGLQGQA
jgi:hypothetical protein